MKFNLLVFMLLSLSLIGQKAFANEWPPVSWVTPVKPFHVAGPVYYVGSEELAAYLLDTKAGLVVVNVGMPENTAMVFNSIRALGYDPESIKMLALTQAHFDHAGGAKKIVDVTGAVVLTGSGDVGLLTDGGLNDPVFGDDIPFPALNDADIRKVGDGDVIELGEWQLMAMSTPGHTPGATSWLLRSSNDKTVKENLALFQASVSLIYPERLRDNHVYPNAFQDFRLSIQRLNDVSASYYFPDHIQFARPEDKSNQKMASDWFRDRDVLNRQLVKTAQLLLNEH